MYNPVEKYTYEFIYRRNNTDDDGSSVEKHEEDEERKRKIYEILVAGATGGYTL
jgi:hypothetical protein